ncbi:MAG: hypothetical protein KJ015_09695 [Myxococcales bacterium]|nr:hypothetical protein [Myxococcales bacterium]
MRVVAGDPTNKSYPSNCLQAWVYSAAREDSCRRFKFNGILQSSVFMGAALRAVRRARGARTPGVDGVTIDMIGDGSELMDEVAEQLRGGSYIPSALRFASVEKDDGAMRVLGIPTIADRLVQHLVLMCIVPVVEADLPDGVFGARPGLGSHHALSALEQALMVSRDGCFIVRTDISKFFDRISHRRLMKLMARRFHKRGLLELLERQLFVWARHPGYGLAQGAPASPVLANLSLIDVDRYFAAQPDIIYVRYIDDVVFVVRGGRERAEQLLTEFKQKLAVLGLRICGRKTVVVPADHGVDFLGVHICRDAAGRVNFNVTPASVSSLRKKIDKALARGDHNKLPAATAAWLDYFARYDEDTAREAVRYLGERTGIQPLRSSGVGRTGPKRKLPVWMRTGANPRTQPAPGGEVQQHPPSGAPCELAFPTWLSAAPTDEDLATLSNHDLGDRGEQLRAWREFLGSELARQQGTIAASRKERKRMSEFVARSIHANPDAVLPHCPTHRELLEFEHRVASASRYAERALAQLKQNLHALETEMRSRACAAGMLPTRGLVHRTRLNAAGWAATRRAMERIDQGGR